MTGPAGARRLEVHVDQAEAGSGLRDDVRSGLGRRPYVLPPKWLYDEVGCRLFDEITRLPEYYPTRAERAVLDVRAPEVARVSGADTLVEIGAGTSEKTGLLLDAMAATGQLRRVVAFDVSEPTLDGSTRRLAATYPGVEVIGVVGDFHQHLDRVPAAGRRLVVFLGSTIGNLEPLERKRFLADLADGLRPGEGFLLGTDLVKGADRLRAAYDDAAGVTAAFNVNILAVINRELGAAFDLARFEHVARWDADEEWMEMGLRSRGSQQVAIPGADLVVDLADGEVIRTEISAKFTRARVEAELNDAGLEVARWWTDPAGDFGVSLSFVPPYPH